MQQMKLKKNNKMRLEIINKAHSAQFLLSVSFKADHCSTEVASLVQI